MTFQVTEVKKPLAAVWRLVEKGNLVQFGPSEAQCFIQDNEDEDDESRWAIQLHLGTPVVLLHLGTLWFPPSIVFRRLLKIMLMRMRWRFSLTICQVEELEMSGDSRTCKLVDKGSVNQVVQQQGSGFILALGRLLLIQQLMRAAGQ